MKEKKKKKEKKKRRVMKGIGGWVWSQKSFRKIQFAIWKVILLLAILGTLPLSPSLFTLPFFIYLFLLLHQQHGCYIRTSIKIHTPKCVLFQQQNEEDDIRMNSLLQCLLLPTSIFKNKKENKKNEE